LLSSCCDDGSNVDRGNSRVDVEEHIILNNSY